MAARFRLDPGDTKAECNMGKVAAGTVMLLFGLAMMVFAIQSADTHANDAAVLRVVISLLLGVIFMPCGALTIVSAFTYSTNTMYVKKGRCTLLEGGIGCSGGCKSCSVALVYIEKMNDGNRPEIRERP